MNKNLITLKICGRVWVAQFSGPIADDIRDLFGTTAIPTAFLATAPADEVQRAIQQDNPRIVVNVDLPTLLQVSPL